MSKHSDFFDECIDIIKANNPEKSLIKISKLTNPKTNKKLGLDKSFEIYKIYIDYSVSYDKKKYSHNVDIWNKKIAKNLKLVTNAYDFHKNNE